MHRRTWRSVTIAGMLIAAAGLVLNWERGACVALQLEIFDRLTSDIGATDVIAHAWNVGWLEEIASSREAALRYSDAGWPQPKVMRRAAYMRLGALATSRSLAALRRIEARELALRPAPAYVDVIFDTNPAGHVTDGDSGPLANVVAPDGTAYRIWRRTDLGAEYDILVSWTTSSPNGMRWARPRLTSLPRLPWIKYLSATFVEPNGLRLAGLQFLNEALVPPDSPAGVALKAAPRVLTIDLDELRRDSDADGWTDIEEARLGLDPNDADTDKDGILEGADVCPDLASSDGPLDEQEQMLQRVFLAAMGFSGSRMPLLFEQGSRRVSVHGYEGPVLFNQDPEAWRKRFGVGAVSLSWQVEKQSGGEAEVAVEDYVADMAAASCRYFLHKIKGEWFVRGVRLEVIS